MKLQLPSWLTSRNVYRVLPWVFGVSAIVMGGLLWNTQDPYTRGFRSSFVTLLFFLAQHYLYRYEDLLIYESMKKNCDDLIEIVEERTEALISKNERVAELLFDKGSLANCLEVLTEYAMDGDLPLELVTPILREVASKDELFIQDSRVRAIFALRRLTDLDSIPILQEALESEEDAVVTEALEKVIFSLRRIKEDVAKEKS